MNQTQKASLFRKSHQRKILVLPNAWDAASASIIEKAGAVAIATTSAGISWSRGVPDGQVLGRERMLDALREIVGATNLPVTADIEGGYGSGSVQDVAETTEAILEAGIVGINLEDAPGRAGQPILDPEEQGQRILKAREVARSADIELFINARTDIYLAGIGEPDARLDAVVNRAKVYLEAGADGIFVPGLSETTEIKALVEAIDAPLNIMAGPGTSSVAQLEELGVARVSLGPAIALAALGLVSRAANEVLVDGTYDSCVTSLSFQDVNGSFINGS